MSSLALPDLTLPQRDTRTVRRVLTAYLQNILQDFLRLPPSVIARHDRALYQQTTRLVDDLARRNLASALQIVRSPTVSALVRTLAKGGPLEKGDCLRECCALILLELAAIGALPPEGVTMGGDPAGRLPILRAPALRLQIAAGPDVRALHFTTGRLHLQGQVATQTVPLHDASFDLPGVVTRPYHAIAPGLFLATSDNNPLSEFEAHPDKHGNHLDLGGHSADSWCAMLADALALIDAHLPLIGKELRLTMQLLVPVGWHAEQHLSASYQEAVGLMYLTLHPNLMTMTEALIHEFQHNKLNAAFRLDPLLENAWSPLYASPVRPDPRPLHGVILAVHAFQPVAALYEAMAGAGHDLTRNPYFIQRFQQIVRGNAEGAATVLRHARPTAAGQALFAEMRALDGYFRGYAASHWPDVHFDGGPLAG